MVLGHGLQGLRQVAPAQNGARPRAQFPHPQGFGLRVRLIIIPAAALVALRLAQQGPATGFVAGARIMLWIDKRFRQQHLVPVTVDPVLAEPLQAQFQQPAGQIGHVKIRQNKKPAVVDYQRQPPFLLRRTPANPLLAGL